MKLKAIRLTKLINNIITARTLEDSLDNENKLLGFVLSIILIVATISHTIVANAIKINTFERNILTLILFGASIGTYFVTSRVKRLSLRRHIIGLLTLVAISSTFTIYYNRLGSLCWFIVVIVTLVLSFTNDSINLGYNYLTYVVLFIITSLFYPDTTIVLNTAYNLTLLTMLTIIVATSFVVTRLYNGITKHKIIQYNNIIQSNALLNEQKIKLYNLAHTDSLTGLANRKMTLETIDQLIQEDLGTTVFAVVFIDLDNFKSINDIFGHYMGDKIIERVATRMKGQLSETNLIGRLGGDEFALIISDKHTKDSCLKEIIHVKESLEAPFKIDNKLLYVTASFGTAFYPYNGDNSTEILKAADTAMYIAKERGKHNLEVYESHMKDELIKRIELESNLLRAMEEKEFHLACQPIIDCLSEATIGYEILLRWDSKKLGLISPNKFIPLAEAIGMIHQIGLWVIKETFRILKKKHKTLSDNLFISINISSLQVKSPDFIEKIQRITENEGINPNNIILELTESVFIDDIDNAIVIMTRLRELGFKIALDDFGTGYSSFAYLLDLPIDILKLDKAFLDFKQDDYKKKEVISNIIKMAHILGLKVIAEGIEMQEQLDFIRLEGCDYAQGYHFSKPTQFE